jgi:predicted dehydrogenase
MHLNPQPYGVGVVGTGIMGRRMLAALQLHPRFQAAVLWDPQPEALQAAVQATPGARAASSLQALLTDPAVALVYIAAPPASHWPVVQAALAAGRACLCEKPLASDIQEAQTLSDAVAQAGLPFAVNFPFARSPASLGLQDAVRNGRLGRVEQARITLRFAQWPRPWQAGASAWLAGAAEGGFTREVLSHFVFLALRLFGPASVQDVRLQRAPGGTETVLQATLQHAGVRVHIDAAVAGSLADDNRFELTGHDSRMALVNWAQLEQDGVVLLPRSDATPATLDSLARLLEGHADHGLSTAAEALAVVRCIECLLQG